MFWDLNWRSDTVTRGLFAVRTFYRGIPDPRKSARAFGPAGLSFEDVPFIAFQMPETPFSKFGEEPKGSVERFKTCPAIPFDKTFNAVKKILNLIPSTGDLTNIHK